MGELGTNQREISPSPGISSLGPPRRRSEFVSIPNLGNVKDFRKVCRLCANVADKFVHILGDDGRRFNLSHTLSKRLNINVLESDYPNMPVVVCMRCTDTLLAFDELAGSVKAAEAALRQRSALFQARRKMKQRRQLIDRKLGEHGVRRCPLCSAALAISRYSTHLRRRHVDYVFECCNCYSIVERYALLPHMKAHADRIATAWNVAWNNTATQRTTREENSEIVELELSDNDAEPISSSIPVESPPTLIQAPQEPEIVEVQENPPQGSLLSENPPANQPQGSLVSENPPQESLVSENPPQESLVSENPPQESLVSENPPQESLVSENPPQESLVSENPPQESRVSENPSANSPVVLNDELEEIVIKLEKKPYHSCPYCPRTFKASSSFFYHIKYFHNQSKEHVCGPCGKRFGTRGMLREHASVHSGERERQCAQCPKKFRTKASLYIHQQTHGAVKKFSCNQCPMAFRWSTQLRRHLTRHAAERKHACATCGKAFSVRADLLRHGRTHARGEHACPEAPCAALFAQPRYLRSHATRKHGNASRDAKN